MVITNQLIGVRLILIVTILSNQPINKNRIAQFNILQRYEKYLRYANFMAVFLGIKC